MFTPMMSDICNEFQIKSGRVSGRAKAAKAAKAAKGSPRLWQRMQPHADPFFAAVHTVLCDTS